MRRRSYIITILMIFGFVFLVGGVLAVLLKHEPEFYADPPEATDQWSSLDRGYDLVTRVQDLKNDIRSKPEWNASFQSEDLNCFFRELMATNGELSGFLPAGCHSPRVEIEGDKIRLGVRCGHGFWSTVIWVEMRAWLVTRDVNVIALELCGMQAGGIQIGCHSLLDTISEAGHDSNVDVTWFRKDGNPVGLFRFYADQLNPSTRITTFKVADGRIQIGGTTRVDPVPAVARGN